MRSLLLIAAFLALTKADLTTNCGPSDPVPPTRVDTTQRLSDIRGQMSYYNLDGYFVPYDDFGRREFITGFSGSDGDAIVLNDEAACWTDGRYYLQASEQLDCNWILMKDELPDTPTYAQWLLTQLPSGSRVGADPTLMSAFRWLDLQSELSTGGISLISVAENLVDAVWASKPALTPRTIVEHDVKYAGKTFEDKIADLRRDLKAENFDTMILSETDEIAWLFNLKAEGLDNAGKVTFNPWFISMALVSQTEIQLWLYPEENNNDIAAFLNKASCGSSFTCVDIKDFNSAFLDLNTWATANSDMILITEPTRFKIGASYAVYEAIPEQRRSFAPSPLLYPRAIKNSVEVEGMKQAHIRDAYALTELCAMLENQVQVLKYDNWTEMDVSRTLTELRAKQPLNRGESFETIAGSGPNGAVIHYRPATETNAKLTTDDVFLLDSGGQFLDGTVDVTRTFHYGTPSREVIERYTWVLMGAIDVATAVVSRGTQDTSVDLLSRRYLYKNALDFRHNTGHGIGAYGGVHENPTSLRKKDTNPAYLYENMFFSDEPGYYEDGAYGIRLETVMRVVPANFADDTYGDFVSFEPVTLMPFEPKLIAYDLMSKEQIEWLNDYHEKVFNTIAPYFEALGRDDVVSWLESKTRFVDPSQAAATTPRPATTTSTASSLQTTIAILSLTCFVSSIV